MPQALLYLMLYSLIKTQMNIYLFGCCLGPSKKISFVLAPYKKLCTGFTHYITICAYDNFVIFSYKQLCQPLAQMMFFMTRVVSGNEFPSMSLSTEVSNMWPFHWFIDTIVVVVVVTVILAAAAAPNLNFFPGEENRVPEATRLSDSWLLTKGRQMVILNISNILNSKIVIRKV